MYVLMCRSSYWIYTECTSRRAFFEKETVTVEKRDGEFVAERSPITLDTREDAEGGVTTADEEDDPMKQRHEELKKELEVMPLQRLKALRDLMKDDQFFLYKREHNFCLKSAIPWIDVALSGS